MPNYLFLNNDSGEEYELFLSISGREQYLKDNPNVTQLVNGAPLIHSGRGMNKPDNGFRDLLKKIKESNSRGITKSPINTF